MPHGGGGGVASRQEEFENSGTEVTVASRHSPPTRSCLQGDWRMEEPGAGEPWTSGKWVCLGRYDLHPHTQGEEALSTAMSFTSKFCEEQKAACEGTMNSAKWRKPKKANAQAAQNMQRSEWDMSSK